MKNVTVLTEFIGTTRFQPYQSPKNYIRNHSTTLVPLYLDFASKPPLAMIT